MEKKIEQINARNGIIIGAETNDELIGFILASQIPLKRVKHRVHIVIGVLKKESGKGIGTRLFGSRIIN